MNKYILLFVFNLLISLNISCWAMEQDIFNSKPSSKISKVLSEPEEDKEDKSPMKIPTFLDLSITRIIEIWKNSDPDLNNVIDCIQPLSPEKIYKLIEPFDFEKRWNIYMLIKAKGDTKYDDVVTALTKSFENEWVILHQKDYYQRLRGWKLSTSKYNLLYPAECTDLTKPSLFTSLQEVMKHAPFKNFKIVTFKLTPDERKLLMFSSIRDLALDLEKEEYEELFRQPPDSPAKIFPHLTYLEIYAYDEVPQADMNYVLPFICQNPCFQNLTHLILYQNQLNDQSLCVLSFSENLKNVIHLDLSTNQYGNLGAMCFIKSPLFSKLKYLDLSDSHSQILPDEVDNIDDGILTAIANQENVLETLNLRYNNIGDKGALILANSKKLQTLQTLDLSFTDITDAGARKAFGTIPPGLANLKKLILSEEWFEGHPITAETYEAILKAFNHKLSIIYQD